MNMEKLKPLKNLFAIILPYLTILLSALQVAFSAINSISTCTIDASYIQQFNGTMLYDTISNQELSTLNITLSSIISVFTVILALYNDQSKKQKNAIKYAIKDTVSVLY